MSLEHAIKSVNIQNEHRKTWQENDSTESVLKMIKDELTELEGAINESMVTGDPWPVASELGDVFSLTIRMCEMLGFKVEDVLDMKTKRNGYKYSDAICNDGFQPSEVPQVAKESWKAMGGDVAYSHIYLNFLAGESKE